MGLAFDSEHQAHNKNISDEGCLNCSLPLQK